MNNETVPREQISMGFDMMFDSSIPEHNKDLPIKLE